MLSCAVSLIAVRAQLVVLDLFDPRLLRALVLLSRLVLVVVMAVGASAQADARAAVFVELLLDDGDAPVRCSLARRS